MEKDLNNIARNFMNNIERKRKITEFKNSISASFKTVMAIKIRKQRLESLLELLEDVNKRINEIEALSTIYKPEGLNEYFGIGDSPSADSLKWKQDLVDIGRLKNCYKIPIIQEIEKVRMLLASRKGPAQKPIEEQYISFFFQAGNVIEVDRLLKSRDYVDKDGSWIGSTNFKGELKACFEVLKEIGIINLSKDTTMYRIVYQRFKYKGTLTERTLRNHITNPEVMDNFKTLFAPLLRNKR